jgi:opacity protein-like surface antigen
VRPAVVAVLLLSGCSGTALVEPESPRRLCTMERRQRPADTGPAFRPDTARVSMALAAADRDEDAPVLQLPPLERWPRTMWLGGAAYALVQLNPYVAQLGVLSQYERADSGLGFGVLAGYRLPMSNAKALGFELAYERSGHTNEDAGVDATATRLVAAARLNMRMDEKLTPFAVAGAGIYKLEFDGIDPRYNLSGLGLMIGGGVDYSPKSSFSLRAELGIHIWAAEEEGTAHGGTAETLAIGLGASVSF